MPKTILGVGALVASVLLWFTRELIKSAFFDKVLHTVSPNTGILLEFIPPLLVAVAGFYFLLSNNTPDNFNTKRHMLSVVLMIGGIGLAGIGVFIYYNEHGHLPFLGDDEKSRNSPSQKTKKSAANIHPQAGIKIAVDCKPELLPKKLSANSDVLTLNLLPTRVESGGGGLSTEFSRSGKEWVWPDEDLPGPTAYLCVVTNYSDTPVFDFQMGLILAFYEAIDAPTQPNAKTAGELILKRFWPVDVAKLEAGPANAFSFYIYNNRSDQIVEMLLPKEATFRALGESDKRSATITTPNLGGEVPLHFGPRFKIGKAAVTRKEDPEIPSLLSLFMSLKPAVGITWNAKAMVENADQKVTIFYNVHNDMVAHTQFVAFYVPLTSFSYEIIENIAERIPQYITDLDRFYAVWKSQGDSEANDSRNIPFSRRVYIYHETDFTVSQLAKLIELFKSKNYNVQFRGTDFVLATWTSIRAGDVKAIPKYEIRNSAIQLVTE